MDSLTQIALGASVSSAVGFKPFGRKVILAGAALATLPDLDVIINYGHAIDNFTSHRGFSHSVFVLTLLSIALYLIVLKLKPDFHSRKLALFLTIYLPLITHPLLDTFTTYGTQLLWPLTSPPIAWHGVFIIDPFYTTPLLISVLFLWFSTNKTRWLKINKVAIFLSCTYLLWGQFAKVVITDQVKQDAIVQNHPFLTMPAPLNTFYWRVLSYHQDEYYEAFTYPGNNEPLKWIRYPNHRELIEHIKPEYLQRLEWFSQDWLRFENINGQLQITDLRLGAAGYHPFVFSVAEQSADGSQWKTIEPKEIEPSDSTLQSALKRLTENIPLPF